MSGLRALILTYGKWSDILRFIKCILEHNDCYINYSKYKMDPTGIVVHSTDPSSLITISRFVQPFSGQITGMEIEGRAASETEMRKLLGKNKYNNDWNRHQEKNPACVHAFLGVLADGKYAVCQTLPFTQPSWGCGWGQNGTYNGCSGGNTRRPFYIQFEMIEDVGTPGSQYHCMQQYIQAVEFCAWLMKQYPSIKLENIVSHKEAHSRGYGTDHGDPESYWKRCNYNGILTMKKFRKDVEACLKGEIFLTDDQLTELIDQKVKSAIEKQLATIQNTELDQKLDKRLGKQITDLTDIPHTSVIPEVKELLDLEVINGGTTYADNPSDIRLPYNEVRVLVVGKRYTDKKLEELKKELTA